MKVSRPRSPISSRVSKLSATKLGPRCALRVLPKEIKVFSVEGVSHGTGPSFDWKRYCTSLWDIQSSGNEIGGFNTLMAIAFDV